MSHYFVILHRDIQTPSPESIGIWMEIYLKSYQIVQMVTILAILVTIVATCVILILANCCLSMFQSSFMEITLVRPPMRLAGVICQSPNNWRFIVSILSFFCPSSSSFTGPQSFFGLHARLYFLSRKSARLRNFRLLNNTRLKVKML